MMQDDCSWLSVSEALKSMGNVRLGKKIEETYGKGRSKFVVLNRDCYCWNASHKYIL